MHCFSEMAAIKHTLQREVFLPAEERLIAVVYVTKVGKKKKGSFLCAAGWPYTYLLLVFIVYSADSNRN